MDSPDHFVFDSTAKEIFLEVFDTFHEDCSDGLALWGYSKYGKDIENIPLNINHSLIDDMTSRLLVGAFVNLHADIRVDLILGEGENSVNLFYYWFKDYPYMVQIVRNFPKKKSACVQVYQLSNSATIDTVREYWRGNK